MPRKPEFPMIFPSMTSHAALHSLATIIARGAIRAAGIEEIQIRVEPVMNHIPVVHETSVKASKSVVQLTMELDDDN